MVKIIHTGDLHLDSAFASLSHAEAKFRRASQRKLLTKLIDFANSECADAIIIAGDLFDSYPIYSDTASSVLSDFKRAEMPIFITPGNHDPYTSDSPYKLLEFPENVHIFNSTDLRYIELPEKKLRIYGAAYTTERYDERILKNFLIDDEEYINILALHSNLNSEGYSPISSEEIGKSGADYVALAHIHKPTELCISKHTHYAYCGCPEPRDFGECYDCGFFIVDIEKGSVSLRKEKLSDISYRDMQINIPKISEIEKAIPSPNRQMHLRLTFVGEGNIPDVDRLYGMLSPNFAELLIADETTDTRDIWEAISENSLKGAFLRSVKEKLSVCEDENERKKLLLAAEFGIAALENRDI